MRPEALPGTEGAPPSEAEAARGGARLPPIAYPILALLFGGLLVWSFSRILLAVSTLTLHVFGITVKGKTATAVIAFLMALNILVGAALVAYGRRVRHRPASLPLLVGGAILLVAGGVAALGIEKPATAAKPEVVALDAQNIKFLQTSLSFTSGSKVEVDFDNKDAGVQHNFVLFNGPDANVPTLFSGTIITGPGTVKYTFRAPGPGKYFFHCAVHPTQMTGTATVVAGGAAVGPSPGAGGGALQLAAKSLAFNPTQLAAAGGAQINIHFNNQDAAIPHNVVVFNGQDASAPVLFRGDPVTGPGTTDYTFKAPPSGTYFFHCEFHPTQMTGKLTVP